LGKGPCPGLTYAAPGLQDAAHIRLDQVCVAGQPILKKESDRKRTIRE
jgi:hypothetical protein